jgi:hypothetical protein
MLKIDMQMLKMDIVNLLRQTDHRLLASYWNDNLHSAQLLPLVSLLMIIMIFVLVFCHLLSKTET